VKRKSEDDETEAGEGAERSLTAHQDRVGDQLREIRCGIRDRSRRDSEHAAIGRKRELKAHSPKAANAALRRVSVHCAPLSATFRFIADSPPG
jgi:hypothetical protein